MKNFLYILLILPALCFGQTTVQKSASGIPVVKSVSGITVVSTAASVMNQTDVTVVLDTSMIVSIGIYDTDSVLMRTLISNERLAAGTHVYRWDGEKDSVGVMCPVGNYYACILKNNVTWDWLRPIGNTSDSTTGNTVMHSFYGVDFARVFAAGNVYNTVGYCENCDGSLYTDTAHPNRRTVIIPHGTGTDQATYYSCTDGITVYYLGQDPRKDTSWFVYAVRAGTNTEVNFSGGVPLQMSIGRNYPSVINYTHGNQAFGTGIAVQKNGNFAFIAHKYLHKIDVINKTTGVFVRSDLTVSEPLNMTCDTLGNLWVLMSDRAIKYPVDGSGVLGSPIVSITGLQNALSVGISPDNTKVTILDGGSSQQVKCYNNFTGTLAWTLGQAGGYANGPRVTTNKFDFKNPKYAGGEVSYVSWQDNRSFWVGDPGTNSSLQYDSARNFIRRVQNMGFLYSVFVDQNDRSRVFGNYLEYNVDYATQAATLVRNWSNGIVIEGEYDDNQQRLRDVVTHSNGRTYALQHRTTTDVWSMVELDTTTGLRFTGLEFPIRYNMNADGSMTQMPEGTIGGNTAMQKKIVTGYSGNNPVYGSFATLASTPTLTSYDPVAWVRSSFQNQYTTDGSGIVVTFDAGLGYPNGHGKGAHLGGIKIGTSKFLWKASWATDPTYIGSYPYDGSFDIGNGVTYAGGFATAKGRNIFWNYHGEFWKASQTNKWNHYYDNGLQVGQFGVVGPDTDGEAPYGMEGNTLTGGIAIDLSGNLYIYHAGEATHGGISRWKAIRLNTIALIYQPIKLVGAVASNYVGTNLMNYALFSSSPSMIVNQGEMSTDKRNFNIKLASVSSSGTDTFGIAIPGSSVTTSWTLSGNMAYPEFDPDYDDGKANFFEILDDQSKIIARFNRVVDGSNLSCNINGIPYLYGPATAIHRINRNTSPSPAFTLLGNSEGLFFSYKGSIPVACSMVDPTAHWNYPKRIRVRYIMGGAFVGYRVLNLQYLNIVKN